MHILIASVFAVLSAAHASELPGYDGLFRGDPVVSPDKVALVDDAQLRILRNEVFAQYGRAFRSDDLKAHFAKMPWYKEDPDFSDDRLTANDKANVAMLTSLEGDRGAAQRQVGEYHGDGFRLLLTGPDDCSVVTGDDLYDWVGAPCKWKSRGRWVVTWTGGTWPNVDGEVQMFELDDATATVKRRLTVGPKQG